MARNSERAVSAQRFADMSFGINQTWQNVLAMRSAGVGYVNSTGKPILVSVVSSTADRGLQIRVDNVIVSKQGQDGGTGNDYNCVQAVVPPGSVYAVDSLGGAVISHWAELRA